MRTPTHVSRLAAIVAMAALATPAWAQQTPEPAAPAAPPAATTPPPATTPPAPAAQPAPTAQPPATAAPATTAPDTAAPAAPAAQPPAATPAAAPETTAPEAPGSDASLPPVEVIQEAPKPPPAPPQVVTKPAPKKKPVQQAAPPPQAQPVVQAQQPPPQAAPPPQAFEPPPTPPPTTDQLRAQGSVVRVSPIGGSEIAIEKVPGAVSTISSETVGQAATKEPQEALQKSVPGITLGDASGNDIKAQIDYRGFGAGPVNGFPQGLAVYQNGVRINEVFGDTVNWDIIPKNAISDITVLSGNPIFGLNAIGGAISVVMKDGFNYEGAEVDVMGGMYGRKQISAQAGGNSGTIGAYFAGEIIDENGWRDFSPTEVKRAYLDIGAKGSRVEAHVNLTIGDTSAGVVAATPVELLAIDRSLTFTSPQITDLNVVMPSFNASVKVTDTLTVSGLAYFRRFRSRVIDGNVFEGDEDDDDDDDDDEDPVGVIDRINTDSESYGFALQAVDKRRILGRKNQFVIGTSFDKGKVGYTTSSELGEIEDNFVVEGSGIFLDDGDFAPRNVAVDTRYFGIYVLDTLDLTDRLTLTFGGRFNHAKVDLEDLTGDFPDITSKHSFSRFNPTVGATYEAMPGITLFAGYSEANRAPTPAELACADPENPCPIESFLTDDPPLDQVVSKTYELGVRGKMKSPSGKQRLDWGVGLFRTTNYDDILFVSSSTTGRGYFFNAGDTLRQGVEASLAYQNERFSFYASYAFIDATYDKLDVTEFSSPAHPLADDCIAVDEDSCITVSPGDSIPGIPKHRFKAGVNYWVTPRWKVGADLIAQTGQYRFGDDANLLDKLGGYARVDLSTSYDVTENIQIYAFAKNIFDAKYGLFGTLFEADEAPVVGPYNIEFENPRSIVPGAPAAVYGGVKVKF